VSIQPIADEVTHSATPQTADDNAASQASSATACATKQPKRGTSNSTTNGRVRMDIVCGLWR
jgi:hypothetical protein